MKIVLPWPDKKLSPNARLHWRAKVGPRTDAKRVAAWSAFTAEGFHRARQALQANDEPIPVTITFYPPDKRHRDDDNMIGSFKAARDGIADALGVNDRRFRPHYFFAEPEKPGRVEVCFPGIIPTFAGEQGENGFSEAPESAIENRPVSSVDALPPACPSTLNRSAER